MVDLVGTQEEKMLVEQAKKTGGITADEEGQVIEGVFDGQNMVGPDEKKYSVPANYASKSKLVEGDSLKLTITADGSFVYKQINLLDRDRLVGQLIIDEKTNEYRVLANNKSYKVLSASVTYYKGEPGSSVTILVPKNRESTWAAVENIFKPGEEIKQADGPLAGSDSADSQQSVAEKDEQVELKENKQDEFLSQEPTEEKREEVKSLDLEERETGQEPNESQETTEQPEDIFTVTQKVDTDDVEQVKTTETQVKDENKAGLRLDNQMRDELNHTKDNQGLEEL